MRRTNRNNDVCVKSLEEALAGSPETYGHIGLLCAGWPCQDNSIAGKRKGLEGEKSGLWKEVARCLRLFKPAWFLGENVPGFLSVNDGRDFQSVIAELQEIGYGVSWRILDSQYFGVAQQRRRLFIVGRFGEPCPSQILFESKSNSGNHSAKQEMGKIGLCVSARDGERQDPSAENFVAFCSGTDLRGAPRMLHSETLVAKCLLTQEDKLRKVSSDGGNLVATTVRTSEPGNRLQGYTATTAHPDREGKASRLSHKLDSVRGVIIGNAVTVNVAEWIGKRIMEYEKSCPA